MAFNLGASSCVAGPSKTRYKNIISHNPCAVIGPSRVNVCVLPRYSSALGVSALKKDVAVSAKRKDASTETRSEKKRKSALEEIIEVETCTCDAFECSPASCRDAFMFPDGGEEEEAAAAGTDGLLAAAQHCG